MANAVSEEYLPGIPLDQPDVVSTRKRIFSIIGINTEGPRQLLKSFSVFDELVCLEEDQYVNNLPDNLDTVRKELNKFKTVGIQSCCNYSAAIIQVCSSL